VARFDTKSLMTRWSMDDVSLAGSRTPIPELVSITSFQKFERRIRILLGREASGEALAPEPPRATRNTPEFTRNLSIKTLFFHFLGSAGTNKTPKRNKKMKAPQMPIWWGDRLGPAEPKSQKCGSSRFHSKMAKQIRPRPIFGLKSAVGKKIGFS